MEAKQILELIEAAFPFTPLPDVSLHQAQLADQSMSREIPEREWEAAGSSDAGKTWRDFSDEELMACDAALSHLETSSFVYYLAAFLSFAVRHYKASWPAPQEPLLGAVVFAFLELVAERGNDQERSQAQKALARYWNTDEASKPLIII